MNKSKYKIEIVDEKLVLLKDIGPWDQFKTITNNAKEVVEEIRELGHLETDPNLLYWDSEGNLTELVYNDSGFLDFK